MPANPTTTLAGNGRGITKSTCAKCRRTVYVVVINSVKVTTDPELITVVQDGKTPAAKIFARRSHDENCERYQHEAARAKLRAQSAAHGRKP